MQHYHRKDNKREITRRDKHYLQLTGFSDKTKPLYVENRRVIYLNLTHKVTWIGRSEAMLDQLKRDLIAKTKRSDSCLDAEVKTEIPGLTEHNFLKQCPRLPVTLSSFVAYFVELICFDVPYYCVLRCFIPWTKLVVEKEASIEPVQIDSIQLPAIDVAQMTAPTLDQIQLPPVLEENTMPMTTEIRPPDFQKSAPAFLPHARQVDRIDVPQQIREAYV